MGLGILDAQDVREAGEKEKRRVEREMQCDDVDTPLNLTVYPTKPQSISEVPSATSRDSWKVESDTLQVKSFVESPRSSTVLKHEDSSLQEFNRGIKNFFLSRSVNEKKVVKLPAIQPPSRKCGFCRQSGHRRNKCPKIAEFNSFD